MPKERKHKILEALAKANAGTLEDHKFIWFSRGNNAQVASHLFWEHAELIEKHLESLLVVHRHVHGKITVDDCDQCTEFHALEKRYGLGR